METENVTSDQAADVDFNWVCDYAAQKAPAGMDQKDVTRQLCCHMSRPWKKMNAIEKKDILDRIGAGLISWKMKPDSCFWFIHSPAIDPRCSLCVSEGRDCADVVALHDEHCGYRAFVVCWKHQIKCVAHLDKGPKPGGSELGRRIDAMANVMIYTAHEDEQEYYYDEPPAHVKEQILKAAVGIVRKQTQPEPKWAPQSNFREDDMPF